MNKILDYTNSHADVIGVWIAVLFPVISIFFGWIYKRGKKLRLVIDDTTNLFKDIGSNIEGLTIKYKEEDLKEDLYLIKGFIFYIGDKDLKNEEKIKFAIQFPKESNILTVNILHKPEEMDLSFNFLAGRIEFSLDYLKDKEYIYFEALIESVIEIEKKTKSGLIKIKHRINDVSNVRTLEYKDYEYGNYILGMMLALCLFVTYIIYDEGNKSRGLSRLDFDREYVYKGRELNDKEYFVIYKKNNFHRDSTNVANKYNILESLIAGKLVENNGKYINYKLQDIAKGAIEIYSRDGDNSFLKGLNKVVKLEDSEIERIRKEYEGDEYTEYRTTTKEDSILNKNILLNESELNITLKGDTDYYRIDDDTSVKFKYRFFYRGFSVLKFVFIIFGVGVYLSFFWLAVELYFHRDIFSEIKRRKLAK